MFRLFYNIAFLLGFPFALPYYLWRMWKRGRMGHAFGERMAIYQPELIQKLSRLKKPIWIHAVSVGEMMLASVVVRELRTQKPDLDIVITTTTVTGRQVGQKLVDEHLVLLYNPVDFFFIVARAFNVIKPSLLVLMEQEIWPNYVLEAAKRKIPVWLLNARLSDRSYGRFKKFKGLMQPVLGKLSFVGAQDEEDVQRLANAGFPAHAIFNMGSMKFDVALLSNIDVALGEKIRQAVGWGPEEKVMLAGSTHAGEEEFFVKLFLELKKEHAGLRLLLAPRHFERSAEVASMCRKYGVAVVCRSALQLNQAQRENCEVLLLDTTGELRSVYELGTVNFIGKSLLGKGGQNFIEATRVGKPVLVGPNMQNFAALTELFVRGQGLIQVKDEAELKAVVSRLLKDPAACEQYGAAAKRIFEENVGAGAKSAAAILQFLTSKALLG